MSDNKRKNKRYAIEGIQGNVLYTSDLDVINISLDGAAIETTRRLELNREYTFKIKCREACINIRGRVVWAILKTKEQQDSKMIIPVYRAGIRFNEMLSEKTELLRDFIEESKLKTIENRLGGVRFKIADSEDVKIGFPQQYKVRKISLSGMLIETEYPLDPGSVSDIELFLNETILNIVGRISNCKKVETGDSVKYDIGIEFMKISENDEKILLDFLDALDDTIEDT